MAKHLVDRDGSPHGAQRRHRLALIALSGAGRDRTCGQRDYESAMGRVGWSGLVPRSPADVPFRAADGVAMMCHPAS
jgi:hypothetical protein